ncbi:glycoside hydrolase [Shewanella sp. A32]|uniref:glycoside hydrolase n=1 Tax=Shewanella sp. A32 TaxID=3031327 RepID=UPI0023B98C27|nr:glycoside hydrolase [Shewanella sp. A32]MDF0532938.1 glycoside hydrolase [Shewanella sp. A32]
MRLYTVFHLNLAFSSIDEQNHADVVNCCYEPILQLAKSGYPIGIEATVYTLEAIAKVAPQWLEELSTLIKQGCCELIASGDSQIIGPLVPADVNRHNLRLGQQGYQALIGTTPTIAYINEQAVSESLLDIYLDAGFDAVIVEWDNPFSHNEHWDHQALNRPATLATASGHCIKVIWNHAIGFQKFQRYVHGELVLQDYLQYLQKITNAGIEVFPVYGSDAEVFDYRPGRYGTEAEKINGEWQRIAMLFKQALSQGHKWLLPSETLTLWQNGEKLKLATAAHPVAVKKQAKYNITRWGLSGRNDVLLNSLCYRDYQQLIANNITTDEDWRNLCRLWASDLRTHLTPTRYQKLALVAPNKPCPRWQVYNHQCHDWHISYDEERRRLLVKTDSVHLKLNANRGLAVELLAFDSQQFVPIVGTLSHGFFDHISYGADFYTNHMVIERFTHRDRVTDLERVSYQLWQEGDALIISTELSLKIGKVIKYFRLNGESVTCGFLFEQHLRPEASIRLGFITLLNCHGRCWYETHLGGDTAEHFHADSDFDHGTPVSSIVSANCAVGATTGEVRFGVNSNGIKLTWDPANGAALPMLSCKKINDTYLNRLWFSLAEADETLKAGGYLPDFSFQIEPCSLPEESL